MLKRGGHIAGIEQFAGRNARNPSGELIVAAFGKLDFRLRERQPRQT